MAKKKSDKPEASAEYKAEYQRKYAEAIAKGCAVEVAELYAGGSIDKI